MTNVAPTAADGSVEVSTTRGTLLGSWTDGVAFFRGIRYGQPPVRDLRFAPPRRTEPWAGTVSALEFGPACPQGMGAAAPAGAPARPPVFGGLFGPGQYGMSEDCLHLNVWTPGCDGGTRPVLVFVHGGAFRVGTGTAPTYDGAALAVRGDVVVVTLNYRLGALGFLHLPELGAVNLGLQDQVAALEWVADEIEAFGGDPSAVTVFGESAGAKSIECLLAMPSARGLFRAAVLQSTYAPGMDAHAAEGFARTVAASAGTADDLTKLRGLPAEALLAAVTEVQLRSSPNLWSSGVGPVVDGEVLPEVPISAVGSGAVPPVPVIVGTNLDEFRLFGSMAPGGLDVPEEALVERLTGALTGIPDAPGSEQVATTYREFRSARGQGCSPADILYAVQTDRLFRQHSISLAEAHAQRQPDVWMYLFTWPAAGESGVLGACHALELPFIFGTLDGPTAALTGTDEAARDLSLEMQDMWLGFARSGVPAGETRWPRYEEARRATLEIGRSIRVVDAPEDAERRFWSRGSRPRVPASP